VLRVQLARKVSKAFKVQLEQLVQRVQRVLAITFSTPNTDKFTAMNLQLIFSHQPPHTK
jgi:hypothetical protein